MAARKAAPKPDPHPFPFLAHGPWAANDYRACVEWQVIFQEPVSEEERARILASVKPPLDASSWSGDKVLTLSTGQDAGVGIWNAYSGQPLSDEAMEAGEFEDVKVTSAFIKAFCEDVDRLLLQVAEKNSIACVIGSTDRADKWHRWSVKQFPSRLLPMFEELFRNARPVAEVGNDPDSLEASLAYALAVSLNTYFDSVSLASADAGFLARLQQLLDRSTGYFGYADHLTYDLRRSLREERARTL